MANATLAEISAILNSNNDHIDKHAYGRVVDVVNKVIGHDANTGAEVIKQFYKVSIGGSVDEVECTRLVGAAIGDTVMVMTMANGYSVVTGRVGGDKDSIDVQKNLDTAQSIINSALSTVQSRLNTAETVTNTIISLGETAGKTTEQILNAWETSTELVNEMEAAAETAGVKLDQIITNADESYKTLQKMEKAAEDADTTLERIYQDAADAKKSASNASEYASRALGGLSTVQNVAETLNWITAHGTMSKTEDYIASTDTEVVEGKKYYERSGSGTSIDPYVYTEVSSPTGNPSTNGYYEGALDPTHVYFVQDNSGDYTVGGVKYAIVSEPDVDDISTYYELSIDESLNNYVATHLAVTDEGLWLIPDDEEGNKVLIATGDPSAIDYPDAGTYIIGDGNVILARFTENEAVIGEDAKERLSIRPSAIEAYNSDNVRFLLLDYNGSEWTSHRIIPAFGYRNQDVKVFGITTDTGQTIYAESCKIRNFAFPSAISVEGDKWGLQVEPKEETTTQGEMRYNGDRLNIDYTSNVSFTAGTSATYTYDPFVLDAFVKYTETGDSYDATISVTTKLTYDATENTIIKSTILLLSWYLTDKEISAVDGSTSFYVRSTVITHAPAFTLGTEGDGAIGDWTVRLGLALNAGRANQTAIGRYNANGNKNAFEIGRGISDSARSNAFSVEFDGETRLYIDGDTSSGVDYEIRTALDALGWASDCLES